MLPNLQQTLPTYDLTPSLRLLLHQIQSNDLTNIDLFVFQFERHLDEQRLLYQKVYDRKIQQINEIKLDEINKLKLSYETKLHEFEEHNNELEIRLGQINEENKRLKIEIEYEKQQNKIEQVL